MTEVISSSVSDTPPSSATPLSPSQTAPTQQLQQLQQTQQQLQQQLRQTQQQLQSSVPTTPMPRPPPNLDFFKYAPMPPGYAQRMAQAQQNPKAPQPPPSQSTTQPPPSQSTTQPPPSQSTPTSQTPLVIQPPSAPQTRRWRMPQQPMPVRKKPATRPTTPIVTTPVVTPAPIVEPTLNQSQIYEIYQTLHQLETRLGEAEQTIQLMESVIMEVVQDVDIINGICDESTYGGRHHPEPSQNTFPPYATHNDHDSNSLQRRQQFP